MTQVENHKIEKTGKNEQSQVCFLKKLTEREKGWGQRDTSSMKDVTSLYTLQLLKTTEIRKSDHRDEIGKFLEKHSLSSIGYM